MPESENEQAVDVLNELIALNWDSREGYQAAAEAVENNHYQSILQNYAHQRRCFIMQLSDVLRSHGGEPVASGNLSGTLQRAWINIKSALTEGDAAILAECDRSEAATLESYQQAFDQELPTSVTDVIRHQMTDVRNAYEHIHGLTTALEQTV